MARDYSPQLALAKRLVRKSGATITLKQLGTDSVDPSKPWRGSGDPRGADLKASASTTAVRVPPSGAASLGMRAEQVALHKDLSEIFIAEPGEDDPEGLFKYNVVNDGQSDFRILFMERLKPTDLTLLYFIGVAR